VGVSTLEGYKICPNCGERNDVSATACAKCNLPLDVANELSDFPTISQTIEDAITLRESKVQVREGVITFTSFRGYRIVKSFSATGAEADTFLLEGNGEQYFLKLYRVGMEPKLEVLQKVKALSEKLSRRLVRIYEVGLDETTSRYFEIMEYAKGGSLKDLVVKIRSLDSGERDRMVRRVVEELAESIHALHMEGIVHRDLKPGNVLVRSMEPLELVLSDFGISLRLGEDASKVYASSFKGTPAYMAPEEVSNYFGKEIDWWHLGIMLYELLEGKNPFAGVSEQVIIHTLVTRGVRVSEGLGERYKKLLKGLLTRDYSKRWGYEQVRDWLEGKEVAVYYEEEEQQELKEWLKAGFNKVSARRWMKLGLDVEEAIGFKATFRYNEAREWIEVGFRNAELVRRWYDAGFSPEEAIVFESLGISQKDANLLKKSSIDAQELKKLVEAEKISPEEIDVHDIVRDLGKGFKLFEKKKWQMNGFNFEDAIAWRNQGFSPEESKAWRNVGFTAKKAKDWKVVGFTPEEARNWRNAGYNAQEAKLWRDEGFTCEEAGGWRKCRFDLEQAKVWRINGFIPSEAELWRDSQFSLEEARLWKANGFTPKEAPGWRDAKFSVEEAKIWKSRDFTFAEAKEWRDKRFDIEEAELWKDAKFEPSEARNWIENGFNLKRAKRWRKRGYDPVRARRLIKTMSVVVRLAMLVGMGYGVRVIVDFLMILFIK